MFPNEHDALSNATMPNGIWRKTGQERLLGRRKECSSDLIVLGKWIDLGWLRLFASIFTRHSLTNPLTLSPTHARTHPPTHPRRHARTHARLYAHTHTLWLARTFARAHARSSFIFFRKDTLLQATWFYKVFIFRTSSQHNGITLCTSNVDTRFRLHQRLKDNDLP